MQLEERGVAHRAGHPPSVVGQLRGIDLDHVHVHVASPLDHVERSTGTIALLAVEQCDQGDIRVNVRERRLQRPEVVAVPDRVVFAARWASFAFMMRLACDRNARAQGRLQRVVSAVSVHDLE